MQFKSSILPMIFLFQTLLFSDQIDKSINIIEKTNVKLKNYQTKILGINKNA